MCHAYRRFDLVPMLAAGPARARELDVAFARQRLEVGFLQRPSGGRHAAKDGVQDSPVAVVVDLDRAVGATGGGEAHSVAV